MEPELISVHVPKTAGITFKKVLDRVYGPDRVCTDNYGSEVDIGTIGPEIRAIHGHFMVARYHNYFPAAKRIAWVRDPIPWVISLYYFSKHVARRGDNPLVCRMQDQGMTLLEYAEHPITRNRWTNFYFYGLDVEKFFFVGVQEHFRDDLQDLAHMMGWADVDPGLENVNPEPGYAEMVRSHLADRALVRRLKSYFADDIALYERVLKLRARRLRRHGRGPRRVLRSLLHWGETTHSGQAVSVPDSGAGGIKDPGAASTTAA